MVGSVKPQDVVAVNPACRYILHKNEVIADISVISVRWPPVASLLSLFIDGLTGCRSYLFIFLETSIIKNNRF